MTAGHNASSRAGLPGVAMAFHQPTSPRQKSALYLALRVSQLIDNSGSNSQMALDMEKEIARHQKGWADFAKWTFVSTVIIIAIVGMMALTLV
jgi:hypothetical protein